ncbi:MAG: carboxy terminal-processing peptidase [Pirellulales bacterium]|nr:carboxy terminal-processing peptidase [Pirellulales bacterium]
MTRMTMVPSSSAFARRYVTGLLLGLLTVSCTCWPAWADPVGPTSADRRITLAVASLLRHEHLSRHDLDDEISQRCLKTFLQSLDPWKVYFYQSDVDQFMRRQSDLDDMVRKGDISFAYEVFNVFLRRVDERVTWVDELLTMQHDFTLDEKMISDRDEARYPQDRAEAFDRWRKRIKYDLLVLKLDDKEGEEAREKLTRRYHSFAKRMHQTDSEELLEMYLTAMATSFDPHTSYMSPATLENFEIIMRLALEGIGASLQLVDGYTVVKKVIPGGAADKDGRLKVEDKIVGVGQGTDGETVDTIDMKLSDVVQMIRGKRGTVVRLEVESVDSAERKEIDITRDKIELKDSEARGVIFNDGHKADGQPYRIGVIDLPSFYMDMDGAKRGDPDYKSTTRDVRRLLDDFNRQHVDALVLDLRRNGGGSLTEAINLTGLFIDEGPVVQVKDADGRVRPYRDLSPGAAWSGPLVVLTSKFSASASEILAGAIQDYGRGLIIGDRSTHGKGTVQSLMDLGQRLLEIPNSPSMGALKITMQQFYRPNGDSTQNRGVEADVELPSLTTHLDVGEADLDYPLAFDHVDPAPFERLSYINPTIRDRLQYLSQQRCRASEKFQEVLKNIDRYKEQKAKKYVTLNEEQFRKERAELDADKEEQKTIEEINDPNQPPIERDYYLDEALAITIDYLNLRQVAKAN